MKRRDIEIGQTIKVKGYGTTWTGKIVKENKKSWALRLREDNNPENRWNPNMMKSDGRLV